MTVEDVQSELTRRRLGYGRGPRMRFEQDQVTLVGGVRHGRTLGSPVAIEIANTEWERNPDKWQREMSPRAEDGPTEQPLTQPRPGHADLAGMQKYGFVDCPRRARAGLGPRDRGPGRGRHPGQAAGSAPSASRSCRTWSRSERCAAPAGPPRPRPTSPASTTTRCAASTPRPRPPWSRRSRTRPRTATRWAAWSRSSPTACRSGSAATCTGTASSTPGWPPALMSIQAVKGVEIGDGWEVAGRRGSEAHDPDHLGRRGRRLPAHLGPGRRRRGRHLHRGAGHRPGRDEAAGRR